MKEEMDGCNSRPCDVPVRVLVEMCICLLVRFIRSQPCLANRICRGLRFLLRLQVFLWSVCSYCMRMWNNVEEISNFMSRLVLVGELACNTCKGFGYAALGDTDICPGS